MSTEALKLALEALKESQTDNDTMEFWDRKTKAITALKQALALDKKAEHARELGLDYEPAPENFMDALRFDVAARDVREWERVDMRDHAEGNLGIGTAQPAPVQEPVAWIYSQGAVKVVSMNYVSGVRATPLYTTPPVQEFVCSTGLCHYKAQRQWVGLTDEEIYEMADEFVFLGNIKEITRAIETKLKEKNT